MAKLRAKNVSGLNIYQTAKHTIIYDIISKKGYILEDEDCKAYNLWSMRFPVAILVGCLLYNYTSSLIYSLLAGFGLYVITSLLFEKLFVEKLLEDKRFVKPASVAPWIKISQNMNSTRIMLSIIMTGLLSILLPLYVYLQHYTGLDLIAGIIVSIGALAGTILFIVSFIIQRKNSNK